MQYRRSDTPGGAYFFTVVTHDRRPWLHEPLCIKVLGDVMRHVRTQRPFETLAMVVMPDHLHAIWRLPSEDVDFSTRWMLIKQGVVHRLRGRMGVPTLWQGRFWEHALRDDLDVEQHAHYIHFNPVKHRLVQQVCDWPHSTFHRYVKTGFIPLIGAPHRGCCLVSESDDWVGQRLQPRQMFVVHLVGAEATNLRAPHAPSALAESDGLRRR